MNENSSSLISEVASLIKLLSDTHTVTAGVCAHTHTHTHTYDYLYKTALSAPNTPTIKSERQKHTSAFLTAAVHYIPAVLLHIYILHVLYVCVYLDIHSGLCPYFQSWSIQNWQACSWTPICPAGPVRQDRGMNQHTAC